MFHTTYKNVDFKTDCYSNQQAQPLQHAEILYHYFQDHLCTTAFLQLEML